MRTTLTLDEDVAAQILRLRKERQVALKEIVNQMLREGLRNDAGPRRPRSAYRTPALDLGRCLIGNVDDVAESLAVAEGEDFK